MSHSDLSVPQNNMYNSPSEINSAGRIFEIQHSDINLQKLKDTTARVRLQKIKRIEAWLNEISNRDKIIDALYADLRKPAYETISNEIITVQLVITYLKKHLRLWCAGEKIQSPLALLGFRSGIVYEPKGHVLIISPWNFPFLVTINPLIYAIAAGNAVIIKPSEMAPHSSKLLREMISSLFHESEVAVIEGGAETASILLHKPFNHIFFTGSTRVGKLVMQAAAQNLASVTLELGGKSPVIVDDSANIKSAAKKIAWAKTLNCGQSCVSPDYLLIHES